MSHILPGWSPQKLLTITWKDFKRPNFQVADEKQAPKLPQAGHRDISAWFPLPGETCCPSGRAPSSSNSFSLGSFYFSPSPQNWDTRYDTGASDGGRQAPWLKSYLRAITSPEPQVHRESMKRSRRQQLETWGFILGHRRIVNGTTDACDFLNYTYPISQTGRANQGKESAPPPSVPSLCSTAAHHDRGFRPSIARCCDPITRVCKPWLLYGSPVPPAAPRVCLFCSATGTLAGCLDACFKLTKACGKNKVNTFMYVFFPQGIVT